MSDDPWLCHIPRNYRVGTIVSATISRLAVFGAFVELEPGLQALLHISEIADRQISRPEDVLTVGQRVSVKIIQVNGEERKVGVSLKRAAQLGE